MKVFWYSRFDFHFVCNFPEFHPGVPWKGLQNIDPENDPDVTPGSVPTGPTINTTIQDVNRYLLKSGGEEERSPHTPSGTEGTAWALRLGTGRRVGQAASLALCSAQSQVVVLVKWETDWARGFGQIYQHMCFLNVDL